MKKKVISTILLLIWVYIIFYLSNQSSEISGGTSSSIIKNFFHIDDGLLELIHNPIRESMHFLEYFVFGILLSNMLYQYNVKKNLFVSVLISFIFIVLDEVHQIFVPGRAFEHLDIFLDMLGSFLGIIIYLYRYTKK